MGEAQSCGPDSSVQPCRYTVYMPRFISTGFRPINSLLLQTAWTLIEGIRIWEHWLIQREAHLQALVTVRGVVPRGGQGCPWPHQHCRGDHSLC